MWGIKDTKVTEIKYWDEGKVELWHAQDGSLCDIYERTKVKSSPNRQNATCLPTSSPGAGFDRHRVVVLQATGRTEEVKAGGCVLAGVRGNEHAWGSKEKSTRGS